MVLLELASGLSERLIDRRVEISAVRVVSRIARYDHAMLRYVEIDPNGEVAAVSVTTVRRVHGDMARDDARRNVLELADVMPNAFASSIAVGAISKPNL